jgi:hypothetical protein
MSRSGTSSININIFLLLAPRTEKVLGSDVFSEFPLICNPLLVCSNSETEIPETSLSFRFCGATEV